MEVVLITFNVWLPLRIHGLKSRSCDVLYLSFPQHDIIYHVSEYSMLSNDISWRAHSTASLELQISLWPTEAYLVNFALSSKGSIRLRIVRSVPKVLYILFTNISKYIRVRLNRSYSIVPILTRSRFGTEKAALARLPLLFRASGGKGRMSGAEQKPSFLGSISPWNTSRSTTPQPGGTDGREKKEGLQRSQGIDHTITHRHHLSLRRYPKDCPPLKTRWFYAVDTPKSKPSFAEHPEEEPKQLPPPKKFVPFSARDSQSIEAAFQSLLDQEDSGDLSQKDGEKGADHNSVKVPVNEDYLYDVDVKRRELAPAYWLGPIYEVRRGTWFFLEGSTLKPCEENLATQLEEGFLKVRPWQKQYQQPQAPSSLSTPASRPSSNSITSDPGNSSGVVGSEPLSPKRSAVDLNRQQDQVSADSTSGETSAIGATSQSHRLFGAYMNSTATYQDTTTAWLTHDDFMSRMSSTVYQRFGGVPGTKFIRGYSETKPTKETSETRGAETTQGQGISKEDQYPKGQEPTPVNLKRKSAPPASTTSSTLEEPAQQPENGSSDRPRTTLERQMSSLAGESGDAIGLEEEARKQEEKEMEDSREADGEERDREIDHLVLVTHGIGQRLGLRLESINFVHDVNVLRKSLKTVYGASPDLQALNSEVNSESKNCRVQVLPV